MPTSSLSNQAFGLFLDKITQYMCDNGIPIPDPEAYLRWCDSAPDVGSNYFRDVWLPLNDLDYVKL
jgi:hypothetical protein